MEKTMTAKNGVMKTVRRLLERILTERARPSRRRRGDSGMTLVEIMIVVAIIGMIVGTVSVYAFRQLGEGRKTTAKSQISQLNQAVTLYRKQHNDDCPKTLDDLVSDRLLPKVPLDPWGQPFMFRCPREGDDEAWDIVSKGPDKKENTTDDIRNE
jgi:general secretion pathway protein G